MKSKIGIAVVLLAVGVFALFLPNFGGRYYTQIFVQVLINTMLAASLRPSLLCGQLNIGHSAFMAIGAYTSALLAKKMGLPFELSLLCGGALAAAVGLIMGYPSLRLRGVYFAMVTVSFAISPYLGRGLRGVVRTTWLRGERIFDGSEIAGARGELLLHRDDGGRP
jgi:ABC-type branched-subunit amino acid transport system permease subunit